ncbi:hypothetical protein NIES4071_43380 [Calothrix sp. NIES-4071]|nr:hypothetical protein NIES4071_43380 [Calothrix sp. NIES-4071]BAZ58652.1 hypothetical protein NIES4105_43310 [Calothrix sp. NIES-4105]
MPRKNHVVAFLASANIASIFATSFAAIPKAEATSSGCSGGSCVFVQGGGLHVNTVQGGVKVGTRKSVYGHVEIWGSGFHKNTSDKTYRECNSQTGGCNVIVKDREIVRLNRNLPNGSKVCARFWRKQGSGYADEDIACVTITR